MAYIDFDEIKDKLKDTYGVVADATKGFASKAAEKAKCTARIAKLSLELGGEKDSHGNVQMSGTGALGDYLAKFLDYARPIVGDLPVCEVF